MRQIVTCIALLSGSLLSGGVLTGMAAAPSGMQVAQTIIASARDVTPESRVEADQGIDAALAAALIGSISSQFDEPAVQVKLDRVAVTADGLLQRQIDGSGRLLLGDDRQDSAWIPFRFAALYDTERASVGEPTLTLGDDPGERARPATARMRARLGAEVDRRLHEEFAQQPAQISLDAVRFFPAGSRYLRAQANGIVDFGHEGSIAADVHALYDTRNDRWLRVRYELGASANRADLDVAVARR